MYSNLGPLLPHKLMSSSTPLGGFPALVFQGHPLTFSVAVIIAVPGLLVVKCYDRAPVALGP